MPKRRLVRQLSQQLWARSSSNNPTPLCSYFCDNRTLFLGKLKKKGTRRAKQSNFPWKMIAGSQKSPKRSEAICLNSAFLFLAMFFTLSRWNLVVDNAAYEVKKWVCVVSVMVVVGRKTRKCKVEEEETPHATMPNWPTHGRQPIWPKSISFYRSDKHQISAETKVLPVSRTRHLKYSVQGPGWVDTPVSLPTSRCQN